MNRKQRDEVWLKDWERVMQFFVRKRTEASENFDEAAYWAADRAIHDLYEEYYQRLFPMTTNRARGL